MEEEEGGGYRDGNRSRWKTVVWRVFWIRAAAAGPPGAMHQTRCSLAGTGCNKRNQGHVLPALLLDCFIQPHFSIYILIAPFAGRNVFSFLFVFFFVQTSQSLKK